MSKPSSGIAGRDLAQTASNGCNEVRNGLAAATTYEHFQLGKCLLNGRHIGRIGGQKYKLTACLLYQLLYRIGFVAGQVVHYDDLAWLQGRQPDFPNESFKSRLAGL